jgi:hypothetical protein
MNFDWQPRTRVIFGANSVERVGELARELGTRPLLVTDPGLVKAGHADLVRRLLPSAVVYDQCRENPTTRDVAACLEVAQAGKVDSIVALGGGSSLDTAKGCNFILTNGGQMQDYWGVGKATRPMLPFIAIPTTAGTGSECQSSALIADPALGGHSALLSRLLALAGVTAALAAGVHHIWFGAIVRSYAAFPPGAVPDIAMLADRAVQAATDATRLAVGLSAHYLVFGLIFNLTLGLAARLAPAIQIFFIAQPLTILGGLALLLLVMGPIISAYATALADWTQAMLG